MTLQAPKMILLDLDGTLVDSVPDLTFSVDRMMERLEMPVRGEAKVRNWVGNGVERLVKRALMDDLNGDPDPALYEQALAAFTEIYRENNAKRSQLYPGVREGLEALASDDLRIGCVTNKPARFTAPLLRAMDIDRYFEVVVAGDTLPQKKPDPAPLLFAAEQFDVAPEDALMVGDSRSDVTAARAAGFAIVCVSYGYNHGDDIREQRPDAVIDSLTELPDLMARTA
ncbi:MULTISPECIES: phosphoglycolate phosphatase [Ectothiorhodospira]|uniref:Phosphoglycolate phosphatase n=1 Tax=Ectothiorhodospira marina TaxID=1396821 RepID=A0A1H7K7D6_9GAMM|nr:MULTISPECIES: phosphoglycolate phosphatase [Ectothiorhodospira]MCG5516606.1 phosphoglycolate phosphatase [Ectothiorhodospira sp. 9100]MCG5519698.1 phosphoglycolate phosphatase [Ectothiorhodospira sp. 9905]SEK81847.1 phosphoglycolate phosphatase [Ectothiorhodospira marina]